MPEEEVVQNFGNRVRLRVCGICLAGEQVLLANHRGIGPLENFWIPPGGGVHFGESAPEALRREFQEETGLEVRVGEFMFVNEFIGPPLHAVELFFRVYPEGGRPGKGTDPEMVGQIITGVAYMGFPQSGSCSPPKCIICSGTARISPNCSGCAVTISSGPVRTTGHPDFENPAFYITGDFITL